MVGNMLVAIPVRKESKTGKKRNLIRDVAIYLSREMTGESGVSLGRYFGGISGSGVTLRYNTRE